MKKWFFVSFAIFFFLSSFLKSATILIQPVSVSANVCEFQSGDWLRFVFTFEVTAIDQDIFLSSVISPSVSTSASSYALDFVPVVSKLAEGSGDWLPIYEGYSHVFSLIGWLKPVETSVSLVYLDKLVFSDNGVDKYTLHLSEPMETNYYQLLGDRIPEPSIMFLVVWGCGIFCRRKR